MRYVIGLLRQTWAGLTVLLALTVVVGDDVSRRGVGNRTDRRRLRGGIADA